MYMIIKMYMHMLFTLVSHACVCACAHSVISICDNCDVVLIVTHVGCVGTHCYMFYMTTSFEFTSFLQQRDRVHCTWL